MMRLVKVENAGFIARIILDRPAAHNALSLKMCQEMLAALEDVSQSAASGSVRIATLEGRGASFCAGADLKERAGMTPDEMSAHSRLIARCADKVAELPCPTLAVIEGSALGGGLELALACDMRVVAEDTVLGFPEITFGFFPGAGGPVRLVRLVGHAIATDLLMTGRQFSGAEAVALRLAHAAMPAAELPVNAMKIAERIALFPPRGVNALRALLRDLDKAQVEHAMSLARQLRDELNEDVMVAERVRGFAGRK